MRALAQFQPRPMPEDDDLQIAILEETFDSIEAVLRDLSITVVDAPASASDTGLPGQLAYDSDYIYVCVAADTWKRVAVATW